MNMKEMRRVIGGVDVLIQVSNEWIGISGWAVRWAKMGNEEYCRRTGQPADTFEWASNGHATEEDAIKAAYRHIADWVR